MEIIDFIEPKKVKDILEQIDGSLSEVGQAKLFEKLVYRYDKASHKRMKEIEDNFKIQDEQLERYAKKIKKLAEKSKWLMEEIKRLEEVQDEK